MKKTVVCFIASALCVLFAIGKAFVQWQTSTNPTEVELMTIIVVFIAGTVFAAVGLIFGQLHEHFSGKNKLSPDSDLANLAERPGGSNPATDPPTP